MRSAVCGVALLVGGLIATVVGSGAWWNQSHAQPPAQRQSDLIALNSDVIEGRQQVVVIDARSRVMSVYHIEQATGVISLKSVRNIAADLLMDEFNTGSPFPREIRAILEQK